MGEIIKLVLSAGFEPMFPINNPSGKIARIAGNRFVASSFSTRYRYKYPRGNIRVTVGNRTTSFYRVVEKKAVDFQNFKTKEIDKIKHFITEVKNRYL